MKMKENKRAIWTAGSAVALMLGAGFSSAQPVAANDVSFQHEVAHAIDLGLDWLKANQSPTNGAWSTPDQPALTALALSAFMGEPSGAYQKNPSPGVQRGYGFITEHAKPDGAIYQKGLENYNTALCVMALLASRNPQYQPVILRARQWLISQQIDLNEKGKIDSPFDGGVGYGDRGGHSDMNNTFTALEAIYYSKQMATDKDLAGAKDLNWQAAIHFIQSCQNLPAYNKEPWVSDDPKDKGGFVYYPGRSNGASFTNSEGKVSLHSYGSISYAGMMSYIYCNLSPQDPRVTGVYDWLRENFTVDENPGMGQAGYYYYLHMMTKGLTTYGANNLQLKNGQTLDWRRLVAMKLLNLQKADGSWSSENNRWWEHDPALVTSYCLLSLEELYPKL